MALRSIDVVQGLIGTFLFLISILFILKKSKSKGNLPGPFSLPLIGNALQIGREPHKTFEKWAKIYGPIFKFSVAMNDTVVLTDPKLVKELLSDVATSGRWVDNPIVVEFSKGPNGLISSQKEVWEAQRKFTIRALKEFGYLKSTMEDLIVSEVQAVIQWFKKSEGKPISGNRIFNAPVLNSLWHLVSGERCEWETSKPYIHQIMDEFMENLMDVSTNGLIFAPFMRHIAPDYFNWTKTVHLFNKMDEFFNQSVEKHKKELDPHNLKDLIDHHLLEIQKTNDPKSSFYKDVGHKNLLAGIFDLFLAGSETTSTTLSWVLLYLSHYQDIQDKLFAEINQVVGTSRFPSLTDRAKMPYTEAVTCEVLRKGTVAPLGIMHCMIATKSFQNYTLEKGTILIANLYAIHNDPKIWGDPENFRPERFLNKDQTKVVRNEALIPFLEGKRKCMGEGFAKDSLFLFITGIFQAFQVLPDPEYQGRPSFEAEFGMVLAPKPYKIVMVPRKGVSI